MTKKNNNQDKNIKEDLDFYAVINSFEDAFFIKDKTLRYTLLNDAGEKYFNKPASKVIGKLDKDIFSKKEEIFISGIDKKILKGEISKQEVSRIQNGENKTYIITKKPLYNNKNKVSGILGVVHDITTSRRRELELSLKNKINHDILENSPVGMFVINETGEVDYVNKTMLDISGSTFDNFNEINFLKHSKYKKLGIINKIKKAFQGQRFEVKNIRYTSFFGERETIRNFIGIPLEEEGRRKVLMIVEDITELTEKENELKNAALEWSRTFDSMTVGISIHSRDHRILNANKFVCNLLGVKKEDLIGKKCFSIFHNLNNPIDGCPLKKTILSKREEELEYYEKSLGKWLLIRTSPTFDKNGGVDKVIHTVEDISEKKQTEIDIKKRNEELEKFNNIAVNREIRMIELKEKLSKLEKKNK